MDPFSHDVPAFPSVRLLLLLCCPSFEQQTAHIVLANHRQFLGLDYNSMHGAGSNKPSADDSRL